MNNIKWQKYNEEIGSSHPENIIQDGYDPSNLLEDIDSVTKLNFKNVLCVGCGFGQEVFFFSKKGYKAIGITNSIEDVKASKKLGVNVVCMDMHDLKFEDEEFDLVFMRQVFEHSLSHYIVLKEISRVTKNNGYVAIFLPYIYSWSDYKFHTIIPTKYQLECLAKKFNLVLIDYYERLKDDRKWNSFCYLFQKRD